MALDVNEAAGKIAQSLPEGLAISETGVKIALAATLVFFAWWLMNPLLTRLWQAAERLFFYNWRLALLGTTGLVLSAASFWVTWEGMTNFTREPVISAMITFGIQGIMLIVAWLIGESFATGMNTTNGKPNRAAGIATALAVFFSAVMLILAAAVYGMTKTIDADTWIFALAAAGAAILLGAVLLGFTGGDILRPYTQAIRVISKNAMLWVMLLACMGMSVFFSFDSRFTAVFPQSERERVAELRANSQVTALLADIDKAILRQQVEQSEQLFQSPGWASYDENLDNLAAAAQGAQSEIETYFNKQIEERNRANKEQQERIASAKAGQAGLATKKQSLADELARLRSEQPALSAEYMSKKAEVDARARDIDSKRVEALAEQRGVEGTGKVGRGPEYRARMAELRKLQDIQNIAERRMTDAKKRLDGTNTRIASIERELSAVDGELAKYKGDVLSAEQRIALNNSSTPDENTERVDPARILPEFEKARTEFRQRPTVANLRTVQSQCNQLYGAMANTPATKPRIANVDCDPKQASDAAAVIFALNDGNRIFNANCSGGDKLTQHKSTDSLFAFAKKCLADSNLPSGATEDLRNKINFTELTRDDKAHRFVVTWNAFNDGNRLAYLALAIAIGLDSLIFMSGLFGANAIRSPLSDVPNSKARSAEQLEGIIENALLPEIYENARLTLHAMRPITNVDGFMAEVRPETLSPHTADRVLTVLNAGASISAVARDEAANRFLIRSELFEYLSTTAKKAYHQSATHADEVELEKTVSVALLPRISENAETVLHYMHPINEDKGYTAEILLNEVDEIDRRIVRNVLNAGATLQAVYRVTNDPPHYWIHRDLYKAIARIRARTLPIDQPGTVIGGPLRQNIERLPDDVPTTRLITSRTSEIDGSKNQKGRNEVIRHANIASLLLSQLNVDASVFFGLDDDGFAAATAASEAFARARESNRYLAQRLNERDDEAHSALDNILSEFQAEGTGADDLRAAHDDIHEHWQILMMLPGGPYEQVMNEMLEELEPQAGAGQLTNDQQHLLSVVRKLREAFANSSRDSLRAWTRLTPHINQAASIDT